MSCLSNPITFIINKSLNSGTNPAQWQKALITAIFKKGKRNNPENYRPISLTSVLSKIMESLVKDAILQHMLHNNLFTIAQHGFLPMRNCVSQLLETMELWCNYIEEGKCVDVLYTAFDSVTHARLISKIETYGISGKLLDRIKAFIGNRKQRVKVRD